MEHLAVKALIQLALILLAGHVSGYVCSRMGQPRVYGQIAAGLLLGPSGLGRVFPALCTAIFDRGSGQAFVGFGQVGLILLLFLVGLEFELTELRRLGKRAVSISAAGIIAPFALGAVIAVVAVRMGWCPGVHEPAFTLFVATAMSVTAVPVLARLLIELNLQLTPIGTLAMTSAAADDAAGWVLLATITAIARSAFRPLPLVMMLLESFAYVVSMVFLVRPVFIRWLSRQETASSHADPVVLTAVLIMVFVSALVTATIGISIAVGGFMMGVILSDQMHLGEYLSGRMRDLTSAFFLPIFFTYTGIRTDIGTLRFAHSLGLFASLLIAAVVGKVGGCALGGRLAGLPGRDCYLVGVLMNTRGLMELVVLNVGLDLGILTRDVFSVLVLVALVTTYMTAPFVKHLVKAKPSAAVLPSLRRERLAS